MKHLNICLIEPEIPQNAGNIARTCAVTGATLHLVKPFGFELTSARLKRAGLDYWDKLDIKYYEGIDDFFSVNGDKKMYFFSQKGVNIFTEISYPDDVYLVFGKESVGLPDALLEKYAGSTVRIPMRDGARCLNLGNCVAVAAYEFLRQDDFSGLKLSGRLAEI